MEHPARPTRYMGAGSTVLNCLIGDIDWDKPFAVQVLLAVQTTFVQDVRQIVDVGDVIKQDRLRLHNRLMRWFLPDSKLIPAQ